MILRALLAYSTTPFKLPGRTTFCRICDKRLHAPIKLTQLMAAVGCALLSIAAVADLTQPLAGPDLVFEEQDGLVAVEAEHFFQQTLTEKRAWHLTSPQHTPEVTPDGDPPHLEGASGGAYLELLPDTRRTHGDPLIHGENFSNQPGRLAVLHYLIHFNNPGRYYVWVRAYSTGTEDNGLHAGLNGEWPASGQRLQWCDGKNSWWWESKQRTEQEHCGEPHGIYLDIPTAGEHEIQFSMREDGFEFDKFILTLDRHFARPDGAGPASRVLRGVLPAAWVKSNIDGDITTAVTGPAKVSGELKLWHRITLDFSGPETSEEAVPNPFLDLRLDVSFVHATSGESRTVPGFFAADGNASETSATAGNVWRVHFSPPRKGEWRWRASFRAGADVAVADSSDAGEPWRPLDGQSGSFVVGASEKRPPDFRARGHLEYARERYLRFAGDGTRFLKGGVDSPETMLGYADFDGMFRDLSRTNRPPSPNPVINLPALKDGLMRFEPHVRDWREGDPTWKGGKGKGLIGGLNYLSSQGVNSAYFLTMNVNGDGMNVWPWIDPWIRDRFDCSKLDQWEIVFSHMTRLGIMLHIVTQETENDHLLDRGYLGRERKLYYRELVARFSHHLAITWNMGEENVQSVPQQKACIAWLRHLLPYRQNIVIHNDHWHAKNLRETFDPLLGSTMDDLGWSSALPPLSWPNGQTPLLTGPAIQDFFWPDIHTHVRHYVRASEAAGLPWVVTGDEMGGANFGTLPDADDPDHDNPRRFGLWGVLMAGGAGVEWYFGWQNNSPFSDLSCEDWRTREKMYLQTKIALDFFHEHLPFWRMQPADEAVIGHGASGLFAPGEIYAVYLPNGGGTRFDLGDHTGAYEVKWFNPRTGGELRYGPIRWVWGPGLAWTGFPPDETSKDWLAVVRRLPQTTPAMMLFPADNWVETKPEEVGVHPNGLHHALNYWRMHSGTNGVDELVMVRRGAVFHRGKASERAHNVWSVTKSFTSTALGLLAADGVVSLETKAAELEPTLREHYPGVRLRDFATMTSGYDAIGRSRWGASSEDWSATPYTPAPALFPPGAKYAYWDEAQMMFGRMLTRAAKRDLLDLLRERVFEPIGLQVSDWTTEGDVNGVTIRNGCTGLQLDALNLARFGHLFLNEGRWGNHQVLPAEWVRNATGPQVDARLPVAETDRSSIVGSGVYGFNWWVNGLRPDGTRLMPDAPAGVYLAAGLNHNLCVVIPEWEMVIVRMGVDGNPPDGHASVLNAFLRRLGLAVSPLPGGN
jgi:CubicO group peptidase (beta-lactamase class C family)